MSAADITVDSGDRMSFTFFVAAVIHGLLIFGIGFSLTHGQRVAPTLNITLATHQDQAPTQADFLAQHNQQASGSADKPKELTAQDQPTFADPNVARTTPEEKHKTTQAQAQQQAVLASDAASNSHTTPVSETNDQTHAETLQAEDEDTPQKPLKKPPF